MKVFYTVTALLMPVFLPALASAATDTFPYGIRQLSIYSDRHYQGEDLQETYVIQEEMIGSKRMYMLMMHVGDEGLDSRPENPRRIKVLPPSIVDRISRLLFQIIESPERNMNLYRSITFKALCGPYDKGFGFVTRQWVVGKEEPLGSKTAIQCSGASPRFARLKKDIEWVYWFSEQHNFALQKELVEAKKVEALLKESFPPAAIH